MLIYDDSFAAVMASGQRRAAALGADVYGSEHMLLDLLSAGGPLAEQVSNADSGVSLDAVRQAIENAVDDAPHLQRLGVSAVVTHAAADTTEPVRMPRNRHTPELQATLNSGSAKLAHVRKTGQLPCERKVDSAALRLAVLEPTARASKLLRAMGSDPDESAGQCSALLPPLELRHPTGRPRCALAPSLDSCTGYSTVRAQASGRTSTRSRRERRPRGPVTTPCWRSARCSSFPMVETSRDQARSCS